MRLLFMKVFTISLVNCKSVSCKMQNVTENLMIHTITSTSS